MLVTHSERPRELKWYHAGPMLYGDWGTSRFYVLGLAFYYSLHASLYYVVGVCALVAAVGWAYTIVCRCYPDGGGVYSAAKHTSRTLAVIGALLLFADYIITASLSALDGMHYFGLPEHWVAICAIAAIVLIGVVNYIGPKKAGVFALVVALATLVLTFILFAFAVPYLPAGLAVIHRPVESGGHQWLMLVNVVLALSGVEAIANMTGIMVPPVTKTAKKAIWPVLLEVVIFNVLFAIAMNALPGLPGVDIGKGATTQTAPYVKDEAISAAKEELATVTRAVNEQDANWQSNPTLKAQVDSAQAKVDNLPGLTKDEDKAKNAVLRYMGEKFVGNWFAVLSGIVFGLLLLSAVNTAVADMISIQYVMSRDTELPRFFTKLNAFGVPWLALIPAICLPVVILCFVTDLEKLADLYAIGVVGAIAINLGSCTANRQMPLKKFERIGMGILAVIMIAIEFTLAYQKPHALVFAGSILVIGLVMRFSTKTYPMLAPKARGTALALTSLLLVVCVIFAGSYHKACASFLAENLPLLRNHTQGLVLLIALAGLILLAAGSSASTALSYLRGRRTVAPAGGPSTTALAAPTAAALTEVSTEIDFTRPHVLVATRGGPRLLNFAANYCHKTGAIMFVLFVRQINVAMAGNVPDTSINDDPEALQALAAAAEICQKHNVPMFPIYAVSSDVAYTILDFAATYAAEAVLMGVSRQGAILRTLRGDVIAKVAETLPEDINLLVHA
jgi:amino acid transporter/nucleotide-binding universal stress UspA family protein